MDIKNTQRGVTLVEMIVVVAIFAVVASILFFKYSDFNTSVSVRNLSQEVALTVRKAQTYATSVRSLNGVSAVSDQFPAYGVSFSPDAPGATYAPSYKQFTVFADMVNGADINRYYDRGSDCGNPSINNECVELYSINTSDKVVQLCTDYPVSDTCISSGTVNVIFRRPAPDAEICIVSGSQCTTTVSYVKVVLESIKGTQKTVTIWNTGQISGQ